MQTAAYHRDTLVCLHSLRADANGVYVIVSIRDAPPDLIADPTAPQGARLQAQRVPEILLAYDDAEVPWTEEDHALEVAYRTMLENKAAARVLLYQDSPERRATKLTEAIEAEARTRTAKEEAERVEAATRAMLSERAAIEVELVAKRAELAEASEITSETATKGDRA